MGEIAATTSNNVKKTAESFTTAWKMGYLYKLINATLHEIHTALKTGSVSKELYDSTKEKAEALRYIASTTKDEALKLKTMTNAAELESHLKKMEVMVTPKA